VAGAHGHLPFNRASPHQSGIRDPNG
jgi:hypothetical protein